MRAKFFRRLAQAGTLACAMVLAGCGLADLWIYDDQAPLPGERIAVMDLEGGLQADRRLRDLEVRLPAPWVNEEWPQVGGYPSHAMHHLALGEGITEVWRASIGAGASGGRRIFAQPVVGDGRLFAMDAQSNVSAFDAASGQRLWQVSLAPEGESAGAVGGGLGYWNGALYATTAYGLVHRLSPSDGSEVWSRNLGLPLRPPPTIFDGLVYVVTNDNTLYALDVASGAEAWNHAGIAEVSLLLNAAAPAVSGAIVVVPFSSGELYALRTQNGVVAWGDSLIRTGRISPVGDINDITGEPVIDRGMVFALSHSGRMAAIDQRTGVRLWETNFGGLSMPWVAGDFLFVVTLDAEVVALTREDGRIRWVHQLERYVRPDRAQSRGVVVWYGPVLAGDRLVLVSSEREAVSLSPYTGEMLGSVDLPGAAAVPPLVADEMLYILTDRGTIVAYR